MNTRVIKTVKYMFCFILLFSVVLFGLNFKGPTVMAKPVAVGPCQTTIDGQIFCPSGTESSDKKEEIPPLEENDTNEPSQSEKNDSEKNSTANNLDKNEEDGSNKNIIILSVVAGGLFILLVGLLFIKRNRE